MPSPVCRDVISLYMFPPGEVKVYLRMFRCSNTVVLLTITFKSDAVLYCNTIISVNALVPDNVYPASRGAGFSSLTSQHMASVNYVHSHSASWGGGGLLFVFVFLRAYINN